MKAESAAEYRAWIIREFQQLWYREAEAGHVGLRWDGVKLIKCPMDLWAYTEILREVRPGLIIEAGTCEGGAAAWLHDVARKLFHLNTLVVSIDVAGGVRPNRQNVLYYTGSSADPRMREAILAEHGHRRPVLVILDSDHHREHVQAELALWHDVVTPGSYLIVEDTNIGGHPVRPSAPEAQYVGPWEAVEDFLREHPEFERDPHPERFLLTWNPGGYLRRR